mmetsp:Transcript_16583/g.39357  ORF Transcript_16583/g.39357 Transcript_16583/m.39357 type:complete len:253 (-) Transcript_16583:819-1577(-)
MRANGSLNTHPPSQHQEELAFPQLALVPLLRDQAVGREEHHVRKPHQGVGKARLSIPERPAALQPLPQLRHPVGLRLPRQPIQQFLVTARALCHGLEDLLLPEHLDQADAFSHDPCWVEPRGTCERPLPNDLAIPPVPLPVQGTVVCRRAMQKDIHFLNQIILFLFLVFVLIALLLIFPHQPEAAHFLRLCSRVRRHQLRGRPLKHRLVHEGLRHDIIAGLHNPGFSHFSSKPGELQRHRGEEGRLLSQQRR